MVLKNKREFIIGLSGLFAIVVLYWGISFLKGNDVFSSKRVFYAKYEKVDGLLKSQPVIIKGFPVGQVQDIYFNPKDNQSFIVEINLTNEIEFPASSIANIVSTDFLGGKAIEIQIGEGAELAKSGDTLNSRITASLSEEINKQVAPLKDKLDRVFGSLDTIIMAVNGIVNEQTSQDITITIKNLRNTFARIDASVSKLDELVQNNERGLDQTLKDMADVAATLKDNTKNFSNIASNFSSLSDSIIMNNPGEALRKLKESIDETSKTLAKINRGEGNIGKLANEEELYENLVKASDQLNKLLLDIKYNPKRYVGFSVFGKSREYSQEEIQEMEYGTEEKKEKNK